MVITDVASTTNQSKHPSDSLKSDFKWYNPLDWIIAIFSLIGSLFSKSEKVSLDPERAQELTDKEYKAKIKILNIVRALPKKNQVEREYFLKLSDELQPKSQEIRNKERIQKEQEIRKQNDEIDAKLIEVETHS